MESEALGAGALCVHLASGYGPWFPWLLAENWAAWPMMDRFKHWLHDLEACLVYLSRKIR